MTPEPSVPAAPAPSMALALGAAAVVLFGSVPLGLFAFVLRAGEVREAWAEGGWPMYAVLGAAAMCSLVAAALVGAAGRAAAKVAVLLPGAIVFPALLGALGTLQQMDGARLAVEHAAAIDRGIILAGSLGESLWCTTFGGLMSGGLALTLAVGLGMAALARKHDVSATSGRALGFGAVISFCAALVAFVSALSTQATADAYEALARLSMADLNAAVGLAPSPSWAMGALATVLLGVVAVAAASLALRTNPAVAVAVGASCLLGVVVLGASTRPYVRAADVELISTREATDLLDFDGAPVRGYVDATVLGARAEYQVPITEEVERAIDQHEREKESGRDEPLQLGLGKGLTAEALAEALKTAAAHDVGAVWLITNHDAGGRVKPTSAFALQPSVSRHVEVQAGTRERLCATPCTFATLSAQGLELEGEHWPLATSAGAALPEGSRPVMLDVEAQEPVVLLRAALTAMQHGRRLTFVVDAPREEVPDEPEEEPVTVQLSGVSTTGPVNAAKVKQVLAEKQAELAECFRGVTLPFKSRAQFVISSEGLGGMVELLDVSDYFDESCVMTRVGSWEFPAAKQRGVSVVTMTVSARAQ